MVLTLYLPGLIKINPAIGDWNSVNAIHLRITLYSEPGITILASDYADTRIRV
jgi:hypothetical protein